MDEFLEANDLKSHSNAQEVVSSGGTHNKVTPFNNEGEVKSNDLEYREYENMKSKSRDVIENN